ncbi:MAG: MarC family protein [Microbacter sp.]
MTTIHLYSFLHLVFIGFIALFPVVNPIGTAFILNPYFSNLTVKERRKVTKRIVFYAFSISAVTLIAGHWILELFGLTVPIIQIAGGIMICKIGWEFLSSDTPKNQEKQPDAPPQSNIDNLQDKLFYPITFPMTTGAGTIAVLFTLSANSEAKSWPLYLVNLGALLLSIVGICILIFFFYVNANRLINYMGSHSEKIVNRLSAFLIFCVGLQIAVQGITHLIQG